MSEPGSHFHRRLLGSLQSGEVSVRRYDAETGSMKEAQQISGDELPSAIKKVLKSMRGRKGRNSHMGESGPSFMSELIAASVAGGGSGKLKVEGSLVLDKEGKLVMIECTVGPNKILFKETRDWHNAPFDAED